MATLHVTVGREIEFTSSPDLPAGFRRAIAADNTYANPLYGKKKGAPETVQSFYHNQFTKHVALPRAYWPQLVARAEEYDVKLTAVDVREGLPPVIASQVAVTVQDLGFGLTILQDMVSGSLPTDWDVISIRVVITRHTPLSPDAQERARPPVAQPEQQPFPWEAEAHG